MKLILAPMATLSHEAFRHVVQKFGGCDEYFTEMINAGSLLNMGPFEKYYLLPGPEPEKIVWQITGNKNESMIEASAVLAQQSGIGIDINMGCSAPQIANTGAGVSWMLKPIEQTSAMVRGIKSSIVNAAKDGSAQKRLSVKLRLGDENFTEQKLFEFCDMLIAEGVEMLTLHPRTKKEKYRQNARWQYVQQLSQRYPDIPVILNGDIKDWESYSHAVSEAPGAKGVMIARMAAQKPWIFKDIQRHIQSQNDGKSTVEPIEFDAQALALDFIDDVQKYQPKEFWPTRLQRFFVYYCLNFSFGHYFQTQMLNAKDIEDSKQRVIEYFAKCPQDRIKIL